jgi:riboflavin biosynthesis pyrimidine reductase
MAGAATARVERYRPLIKTDELRARRAEAGVAENPLAVFVSGALDLPDDLPILQDPESRVAIVTRSDRRFEGARAEVTYLVQAPGSAELAPALSTLRTEHGVRSILCEGGPHLNDSLLREGLVDELFLCVSPKLAGDSSQPAAVEGTALPAAVDMELLSLHEADGHVFFRYRVSR